MGQSTARDGGTVSLAMLIVAVAAGDDAAFRQIYDLRASRLFGIAMRITRQPALSADAVQEAFLELWSNAGRFDEGRGNPDVWLASLVRYRALDMMRRRSREAPEEDVPEAVDEEPDALTQLVSGAETAALRACMDRLPEDRRALLSLAFLDGLSHSQLAARQGATLGSVKHAIRRSLMALRDCLEAKA